MTKLTKVWQGAHTDYSLTLIVGTPYSTHKTGDRIEHYIPHGFRSKYLAQNEADEFNARPNRIARGDKLVVEATEQPAGWSYVGRMVW